MDALTRTSRLIETLRRDGRIEVASAAIEFGTAELTIRRDLDLLAERGVLRRVRGGAVSLLMRGEELPFAMRELDAVPSKQHIAAVVDELLDDGEAVGLDSGTTTLELARRLARRRLTVMPLSLHAAIALGSSSSIRLLLPGGEARPGELALIGPLAVAGITGLRFDTAVLGCCGLSPEGEVTTHDLGDLAVKQALISSARRTILVLDGSKFSHSALAVVAPAITFDVIVTDASAPESSVAALRAAGVDVRVAEESIA